MSSSSASKFQDHYFVLGIDPKADTEMIRRAFDELKARYEPSNTATADPAKLEAAHVAYEVLSDVLLRRAFDRLKGVNQTEGDAKFSGPEFFELFGRDTVLRVTILCILYDRRRTHPYTPTLSMRALENIVAVTSEELFVALWYLKQRNLVVNDDKSSLQITVDGLDFLESKRPSAAAVLPLIKPSSIEGAAVPNPVQVAPPPPPPMAPPTPTPPAPPVPPVKTHESVLSVLNRALSRV
jgi:hypothetical protein